MFKTEPGQERYKLGFKEEVLFKFDFLIKEYGFRCVKMEATIVRYESQKVFINLYHGRASYELGFEIGLQPSSLDINERKFTLGEIIELEGVLSDTCNIYYQVSTQEGIKEFVPKMAELIKKYAVNALEGDVSTFEKLEWIQKQRSDKYLKDMELNRIRPKAEEAWHNKRYDEFIRIYEPIQNYISPAEVKKLEYAKKHIEKE